MPRYWGVPHPAMVVHPLRNSLEGVCKAGPTLERPSWAEHGVGRDSGQHPAQDVVLLYLSTRRSRSPAMVSTSPGSIMSRLRPRLWYPELPSLHEPPGRSGGVQLCIACRKPGLTGIQHLFVCPQTREEES